jgi:hypothetical protein
VLLLLLLLLLCVCVCVCVCVWSARLWMPSAAAAAAAEVQIVMLGVGDGGKSTVARALQQHLHPRQQPYSEQDLEEERRGVMFAIHNELTERIRRVRCAGRFSCPYAERLADMLDQCQCWLPDIPLQDDMPPIAIAASDSDSAGMAHCTHPCAIVLPCVCAPAPLPLPLPLSCRVLLLCAGCAARSEVPHACACAVLCCAVPCDGL